MKRLRTKTVLKSIVIVLVSIAALFALFELVTFGGFLLVTKVGEIKIEQAELGFKRIVMSKGFAHFFFEYPDDWDFGPNFNSGSEFFSDTRVSIGRKVPLADPSRVMFDVGRVSGYRSEILFGLRAERVSRDLPNGKYLLDLMYDLAKHRPNFALLWRSPVEIDSNVGEQIVYSEMMDQLDGTRIDKITRIAVFDKGRTIYLMEIIADQSVTDEAKADFEHILKTFRILD